MSKSSIIALHGSFGSPFENWFPWLQKELGDAGVPCFAPHLPTPDGQSYESWTSILDGYIEAGLIDENSIFLTHSSAGMFAVRFLADRGLSLTGLVTVSGFDAFVSGDESFDEINSKLFTSGASDYEHARAAIRTRVSFWSTDDPYLPTDKLRRFAEDLGAEAVELDGAGHFNEESGFGEFPLLLEKLLEIAK